MYCIVEITKYHLSRDYEEHIRGFILRLRSHEGLDISTNETSTIVRGEYDRVMSVVNEEMRVSFVSGGRTAFVLKVLNTERE
jgi:uncharacterized protein YqgV (UPF0045/DUF77 family)